MGDFTNWDGYYGTFDNPEEAHGFVTMGGNPRHLIIPSPGTQDFNTCNGLTTVPPGAAYSARLGNDNIGGEAEELRYTFPVTSENNLFIYKYAVVLQDPGHIPEHQPSFTIEVRNQDGVVFDSSCGYYYVYAHPGLPGWNICNNNETVMWKDWTTVGMDLSPFVGQTVTIVFITRDCQELGHFGYAYLSTHCDKLQLEVGFCLKNSTVTVTAPPGFSYLWDSGETTQSISVVNPVSGMIKSCRLTAVNGCQVTIQSIIEPTILTADFSFDPQCAEVPVSFQDKSTINQNSIVNWQWDFGDGTQPVTNNPAPSHIYTKPGTYNASLVTFSSDPCADTVTREIIIPPMVTAKLGDDRYIKWSETVELDAGNPGAQYLWSTGETTRTIITGGTKTIWVRVFNDHCTSSDTIVITEYPRCIAEVPTAFSPNGDGQNDILTVFGSGYNNFEFLIFNRSGELVFKSNDPGVGWDGIYQGQKQGMGVYNYILRGSCVDGDNFFKKGNITLLR